MKRLVEGGRLAGYGAAYFFAAGAFMSYWPVWLRDRGTTDAEIGTLFMSRQLVSVVSVLGIGLSISFGLFLMLAGLRGVIIGAPITLLSVPCYFGMRFAERLAAGDQPASPAHD